MSLTSFWCVFEYLTCFLPVPPPAPPFFSSHYATVQYLLQKGEVTVASLTLLDWPGS